MIGVGYGIIQLFNREEDNEITVETSSVVMDVTEAPILEDDQVQKNDVTSENEGSSVENSVDGAVSETLSNLESSVKEVQTSLVTKNMDPENPFTGEVFGAKEGSRVSLLATNMVWVEVKSADKVIFTRVLKKGESYNAPILEDVAVLKTGNAGALSIYLDGQFKKVLGREGHVLKDIKLIPETFID